MLFVMGHPPTWILNLVHIRAGVFWDQKLSNRIALSWLIMGVGDPMHMYMHTCTHIHREREREREMNISRKMCKIWLHHYLDFENFKYLRFYWRFWVVISRYYLKLHRLSIFTQKGLKFNEDSMNLSIEILLSLNFSAILYSKVK